jgi:hypothetical protein
VATKERLVGLRALAAGAAPRNRAALAGVVVLGLLFIVALGSRSVSFPPSEPGPTSPAPPASLMGSLVLVAAPAIIAGIVALLLVVLPHGRSRGGEVEKAATLFPHTRWWLRVVMVIGTLAIVAVPVGLAIVASNGGDTHATVAGRPSAAPPAGASIAPTGEPATFRVGWTAVAIVAAASSALVVVLASGRVRGSRRASTSGRASSHVRRVIFDSIDDLRNENDARRAVIAAYARMEHDLSAMGVARDNTETASEYLGRVLTQLDVTPYSARRLTDLFERAKFGGTEVDDRMKRDAIACLERVAMEVEGT